MASNPLRSRPQQRSEQHPKTHDSPIASRLHPPARPLPHHRPGRAGLVGRDPPARGLLPGSDAGLSHPHRHLEPAVQRHRQPGARRQSSGPGRRARCRAGGRPLARLDARHAASDKGHGAGAGLSHHLGLAAAGPGPAGAGQHLRGAHEGGRLHRRGQDQHARVRPGLAHLQHAVRAHPQRLGSGRQRRRLQRRRRRGAGAAPAAGGRWVGLHGLSAQPRGLEPHLRPAAQPGPGARLPQARAVGEPVGHGRADGAQRARPGAPAADAGRVRCARAAVTGRGRVVTAGAWQPRHRRHGRKSSPIVHAPVRRLTQGPQDRLAGRPGRPPRRGGWHPAAARTGPGRVRA